MRAGAPDLHIVDVRAVDVRSEAPKSGASWRASITLTQGKGEAPYALSVPLLVRTAQGESSVRVPLAATSATVNVDLPGEPLAVLLDPQMRLFRRLAAGEAPPILRQAMLARAPALLVLGGADDLRRAAGELAGQLFEQTPRPASARAGSATLMVVGTHADVDAWLAKEQLPSRPAALAPGSGSAQVWMVNAPVEKTADKTSDKAADKNAARVILVVSARDAKSVVDLLRPLPHYGQQSFVVFDGARAVARGVWPPEAQGWRRGG